MHWGKVRTLGWRLVLTASFIISLVVLSGAGDSWT